MRAKYVIEEIQRVLDVSDALEKGDFETVGQKMYETHYGMSKLYEVSCEELDFLNDVAFDCGVTGSRVMGRAASEAAPSTGERRTLLHFHRQSQRSIRTEIRPQPKVYDVVISDGARRAGITASSFRRRGLHGVHGFCMIFYPFLRVIRACFPDTPNAKCDTMYLPAFHLFL